jgi:hypothetical protein
VRATDSRLAPLVVQQGAFSGSENDPFRDPTSLSIWLHLGGEAMEPNPTCPTCGTLVDLTRRNAVNSLIHRHVMCRNCGVICILEGPERNVIVGSNQTSAESEVARSH